MTRALQWPRAAPMLPGVRHVVRYLAALDAGRTALWCYALWYVSHVALRFEPSPRLWTTSLGLSAIIGTALVLSTRAKGGATGAARPPRDRWVLFRLFLMPFCVSSFAALVKDHGYVLVFAPTLGDNLPGLASIAAFVALVAVLRRWVPAADTHAGADDKGAPQTPSALTLQAYRETLYHVSDAASFALRIGLPSSELRAAHAAASVSCSAFVTACNPRSEVLPPADNNLRQNALCTFLREQGWRWLEGRSEHPTNGWPAESSVLVLGMPREVAVALARRFEQHALVWAGADGVPELVLCT
jgi:hypothetical protein